MLSNGVKYPNQLIVLKAIFPLFNAVVLAIYLIKLDIYSKLLPLLIAGCICFCLMTILTLRSTAITFQYLQKIQITFFAVILLFIFFELISRLFPNLIPLQIRNYLATQNIEKGRVQMVEYLNESPFVKFKPKTIIRCQGYRGTDQQFVYEWKTDKNGFKNLEKVANMKQVDVVALGDSFTEGMGVATDKIWPSILTAKGYTTYNLGVQGYGPKQFEGVLRKYGLHLKPKYVIIGYYEDIYSREEAFFDENYAIKNKKFRGGIQSVVDYENRTEIKIQAKWFVSAVWLLWHNTFHDFINKQIKCQNDINSNRGIKITFEKFRPYTAQIFAVSTETMRYKETESGAKAWENTLTALTNIINMAKPINAKVILLYIPQRGPMYFKKATGQDVPNYHLGKVEASLLKKFTDDNNIDFLNSSERIERYVNQLTDKSLSNEYPYLEIDGHLSNRGHLLIDEELLEYFKSKTIDNRR